MPDDLKNTPPDTDPKSKYKSGPWMDLSHGFEFALTAIGCMIVGHWLEKKYGFQPWGLLGGLFLGAAIGMINLFRKFK